ncbi:N-terminal kinase-like protein [Camarhynchus parvulus]|uniref:N-terminal kinase-like protein n=1 Tax=Geospiza parvula TaxID=87175 RepID=UPI001237ADBE|nr:N-terminal kinase-like protein [Camarhynchus parvulus]
MHMTSLPVPPDVIATSAGRGDVTAASCRVSFTSPAPPAGFGFAPFSPRPFLVPGPSLVPLGPSPAPYWLWRAPPFAPPIFHFHPLIGSSRPHPRPFIGSPRPRPRVRHRILPPGAAAASSGPAPAPGPARSPGSRRERGPGPAMWLFSRDPVRDFPFELGPPDADPEAEPLPDPAAPAPLWRLLRGRRKADGAPVSVFAHSLGPGVDPGATALARAGLKRLRSLRHPNILGYLDSLETEQCLYLVTEAVTPLRRHLRLHPPSGDSGEQEVAWGLQRLLTALAFLGVSGLVHHALGLDAVFVDPGGEWKLGGLERVAATSEGTPTRPPGDPPRPQDPPELSDPSRGKGDPWAGDMWRLGCLIWEVFNGPLPRPGALRSFGKLPPGLIPPFSELVAADPGARPGPGPLLERLQRPGAFLACALVRTGLFLEHFQVRDPSERRTFLQELPPLLESLPGPFRRHKLLPRLLEALELGSADASALPPAAVAKVLDPPEYQERIVPVLVRLFSSPERGLRLRLLQLLEEYIEFLPEATVDSQIFPHVAHGFLDSNPAIREQTVKSMVLLAPKLGEGRRGGELPRLLLRVQGGDALGPLRCNATLCLGRLAPHLPAQTRRRVLAPALARATRDPFPPARAAAVAAFAATHGCYSPPEVAARVLPPLCALTVDPHPGVRQQAFRAIRSFLEQLEAAAEAGGVQEGDTPSAAAVPGGGAGGLGAAVSWAVTGVTSLTARLMGGEGGAAPAQPPPTQGPPQTPAETPGNPQKSPPARRPPPRSPPWKMPMGGMMTGGVWRTWSCLGAPPPAARRNWGPPRSPPPPQSLPPAPLPQPGGVMRVRGGGGGVPSGPPPGRRQREQQRRRELEAKRRAGPRGPQKLGARKLD